MSNRPEKYSNQSPLVDELIAIGKIPNRCVDPMKITARWPKPESKKTTLCSAKDTKADEVAHQSNQKHS